MRVKARMGMSVDGFVADSDGVPSFALSEAFVPGQSHGYPEFIEGCDAAVMGRETFLPALGAPSWPWGDLEVYVLSSRPLPPQTPEQVVRSHNGVLGLVGLLRSRERDGDVHLVGGPRTIEAFSKEGALDTLEVVVLPFLLGAGVPLWPEAQSPPSLSLIRDPRTFSDGSVELVYTP